MRPIPEYIATAMAAIVVLLIMKKWGDKLNPKGSPLMDRVVDVLTGISGASVIAALSSTPLITSLSNLFGRFYDLIGAEAGSGFGIGVTILTTGITVAVAVGFFIKYEKSEKWLDLLWFGLAVLAAAVAFPWINDALSWWATHPIVVVWNILVGGIEIIFGLSFG